MPKALLVTAIALTAIGCSQSPTIPKIGDQPITLSITASARSFKLGTPDTLRVTITNTLTSEVQLQYGNNCQLEMFVRDVKGNVVIPAGGKSTCAPVATTLNIPAKGAVVKAFIWNGGTAFLPTVTSDKVAPGSYYVSAEINALNYNTVLPALKIDVTS